jgi:preprotein translocase subunit SecY
LAHFLSQGRRALSPGDHRVIVMVVAVIAFVVFMERALRKIHIQYPRRQVGMKIYDGSSSHLPIKVNPAGVIPAIFASSLLLLPTPSRPSRATRPNPIMSTILAYFGPGQPLYLVFFAAMIVFFAYFYTANVSFKSDDVAENLKNQGGFIPGIRPGKKTEDYLDYVVEPDSGRRLRLSGRRLPSARGPAVAIRHSVLFRRHVGSDRGVGDDGHDQPDAATCWRTNTKV